MKNIVEIQNMTYQYVRETGQDPEAEPQEELVTAIEGLSLDVEQGSFLAVIGRNGSGKSTLAKNINGLFVPTEGVIYVDGWDTRDDEHIWDVRQTAGMVFQNPDNQLVSSIVEDDVAFGPENLGIDPAEIQERVDEALKGVNMFDYRYKSPHQLSGGQKQRIAIAGVVAMRPRCIVFDEPTAMLDPKGRKDVLQIIRKLHEEGITVILITHFMDEAAMADRVVILDHGKVRMDGTPAEVFRRKEELLELGLEIPMAASLAESLRMHGIPVPEDVITQEALTGFLCQYRSEM